MLDEGRHAACVDAWLKRSAKNLPARELVELFESALTALWVRTNTTLGDVTLAAIADRVLYNAAERFPSFGSLSVETNGGIQFEGLREREGSLRDAELLEAVRFVLVEFLTVLGNLTAEILTPALHAELSRVVSSRQDDFLDEDSRS